MTSARVEIKPLYLCLLFSTGCIFKAEFVYYVFEDRTCCWITNKKFPSGLHWEHNEAVVFSDVCISMCVSSGFGSRQ